MHENGQRMITRQYRNDSSGNEVLVHDADIEYYSSEQAGGHTVYTDGTATIQVGGSDELRASQRGAPSSSSSSVYKRCDCGSILSDHPRISFISGRQPAPKPVWPGTSDLLAQVTHICRPKLCYRFGFVFVAANQTLDDVSN